MSSNAPFGPPLTAEGVTIVPRMENGVLRVAMSGAVEMRDPGVVLNPYWNGLDEEVRRRGIKRVEVDMRDLNFMNSSGILTLVRWVTRAGDWILGRVSAVGIDRRAGTLWAAANPRGMQGYAAGR